MEQADISSTAVETELPRNEDIERGVGEHDGIGFRESGHGLLYHLKLCILFLIRVMQLGNDGTTFGMTAEHKLLNPFDDIVLMLQTPSGKYYYLIQAKHGLVKQEKEIIAKDILKEKFNNWGTQFTLQKYFKGYCQLRRLPEFKSAQTKFVVCTNISIDFDDLKTHCISIGPCIDEYFSTILKESLGNCYKFNSKGKSVLYKALKHNPNVSDDDINNFLDELILAVNLPNVDDLTNIIKKEIRTIFNCINTDLMTSEFQEKLLEWLKQRKGTWLTLDEGKKISDEIVDAINSLGSKGLDVTHKLRELDVNILQSCLDVFSIKIESFLTSEDDILQVVSEQKTSYFSFIKIYQILLQGKQIQGFDMKPQDGILFTRFKSFSSKESRQYIQSALNSEQYKLLVVYSRGKDKVSRYIYKYLNKVTQIVNKRKKKLVLITEKEIDLSELEEDIPDLKYRQEEDDGFTFLQLNENTKSELLSKNLVIFQGNEQKTSLASLLRIESSKMATAHSEMEEIFNNEILFNLIKNKDIKIGKKVEGSPVLSTIYKSRKLRDEETCEIISEEDLQKDNRRIVIINDEAGTGKSTLLNSFLKELKKNDPFYWVCRINLINYTKVLNSEIEIRKKGGESFGRGKIVETLDFFVDKLLESHPQTKLETPFEKHLFKLSLQGCINTILVLDAFDEICPDYKEIVLDLLNALKEMKITLFITSRPEGKKRRIELTGARYLKITPLTEEDQISFLTEYWARAIGIEDEPGLNILEAMGGESYLQSNQSMLENPLFLLMTAEYWQNSIISVYKSLKTSSSKYLFEAEISRRLNYIELRKYYVNKKLKIYQIDKSLDNVGNISSNNKNTFFINAVQKFHCQIALSVMFGQRVARELQREEEPDETIKTELPKIGLVDGKEWEFHFVHTTFAEHFAIEFIHNNPSIVISVLNPDDWEKFMQKISYGWWDISFEYIIQGWFDIYFQKENQENLDRLKYILTYIGLVRRFRHVTTKELTDDDGPEIDEDMKEKLLSVGLVKEEQPKPRKWRGFRFVYWRFGEHFIKDYVDKHRYKALTLSKYWHACRMEKYFRY